MLSAEDADLVKKLSGVDEVFGSELLGEHFSYYALVGGRIVYTPLLPAEGASMSRDLGLRSVAEVGTRPVGRPALT